MLLLAPARRLSIWTMRPLQILEMESSLRRGNIDLQVPGEGINRSFSNSDSFSCNVDIDDAISRIPASAKSCPAPNAQRSSSAKLSIKELPESLFAMTSGRQWMPNRERLHPCCSKNWKAQEWTWHPLVWTIPSSNHPHSGHAGSISVCYHGKFSKYHAGRAHPKPVSLVASDTRQHAVLSSSPCIKRTSYPARSQPLRWPQP